MDAQTYIDSNSTAKLDWMKAASDEEIREMNRQVHLIVRSMNKYSDSEDERHRWRKANAVELLLHDWVRTGKPVWAQ